MVGIHLKQTLTLLENLIIVEKKFILAYNKIDNGTVCII
jgi:50S ribosomal subunit-associated GTPase HflX